MVLINKPTCQKWCHFFSFLFQKVCQFFNYFSKILYFLGGASTSICHFFRPSVCPCICLSVCPSVRPSHTIHISEIIHYLTIIFGTRESNGDTSRCFFHFFKIFIFWDFKKLHPSHAISQEQYRYSIRS